MNSNTCSKCWFYVSDGPHGTCHRYPQTANKSYDDWCGEWRSLTWQEERANRDSLLAQQTREIAASTAAVRAALKP